MSTEDGEVLLQNFEEAAGPWAKLRQGLEITTADGTRARICHMLAFVVAVNLDTENDQEHIVICVDGHVGSNIFVIEQTAGCPSHEVAALVRDNLMIQQLKGNGVSERKIAAVEQAQHTIGASTAVKH